MYHNPVLLSESVVALNIHPSGIYVDATFGGGGHATKIIDELDKNGRLLAFDQDPDSKQNNIEDPRFQFINSNFSHLARFLQFYRAYPVNGIFADLGVSSYQFDTPHRGFSYRHNAPLDMRMNFNKGVTAENIVNNYSVEELSMLFYKYGELKNARKIAEVIEIERKKAKIETTEHLTNVLKNVLFPGKENKILSQIFQALRIEVNNELEVLELFLEQTVDALATGGRLVIISYHSLEDRLVKNFMRAGNCQGKIEKDFYGNILTPFKQISRKTITASEEEIARNNRARSAKLRVVEKI